MTEKEIRLDQTKKVFEVLAKLISEKETCSYRYLIYDLLGFAVEDGAYMELIDGMTITNFFVEVEDMREELENFIKQHKYKEIGIWKRYNMSTGELEKVWVGFQWKTGGHSYMISYETEDRIIESAGGLNLDILYDLIKADLVEKVDE